LNTPFVPPAATYCVGLQCGGLQESAARIARGAEIAGRAVAAVHPDAGVVRDERGDLQRHPDDRGQQYRDRDGSQRPAQHVDEVRHAISLIS
jgi:hypothetical protein